MGYVPEAQGGLPPGPRVLYVLRTGYAYQPRPYLTYRVPWHPRSPELIAATDGHTGKTDVWSLGITAIEMAEGRTPHAKLNNPVASMFRIVADPPPTLGEPARWSADFASWLGLGLGLGLRLGLNLTLVLALTLALSLSLTLTLA